MTRVGPVALRHMRHAEDFVAGVHSLGDLSPDRRFILHFPEERLIWSVGSGHGGNALLGKWIVERIRGKGEARETPIGHVPAPGALDVDGLEMSGTRLEVALRCDRDEWSEALDEVGEFYGQFGSRLPAPIREAHAATRHQFGR